MSKNKINSTFCLMFCFLSVSSSLLWLQGGSGASSVKFYMNVTLRALSFSSETFRSNFSFVGFYVQFAVAYEKRASFAVFFIRHITNYIAHQGVSAELQKWNLFSSTMKEIAETKAAGEFKLSSGQNDLEQTFR